MGFWDTISKPFKAIGHGIESAVHEVEHVGEEVWSGIGHVAEHIEHDVGTILEHAEHDVQGVAQWGGHALDKAEDAGIGALNSMEMLPYLAGGVVIFLVINSGKTSQLIDSGARAVR